MILVVKASLGRVVGSGFDILTILLARAVWTDLRSWKRQVLRRGLADDDSSAGIVPMRLSDATEIVAAFHGIVGRTEPSPGICFCG